MLVMLTSFGVGYEEQTHGHLFCLAFGTGPETERDLRSLVSTSLDGLVMLYLRKVATNLLFRGLEIQACTF
jgi:hypothetical protein